MTTSASPPLFSMVILSSFSLSSTCGKHYFGTTLIVLRLLLHNTTWGSVIIITSLSILQLILDWVEIFNSSINTKWLFWYLLEGIIQVTYELVSYSQTREFLILIVPTKAWLFCSAKGRSACVQVGDWWITCLNLFGQLFFSAFNILCEYRTSQTKIRIIGQINGSLFVFTT
jgi:hypothetical protein